MPRIPPLSSRAPRYVDANLNVVLHAILVQSFAIGCVMLLSVPNDNLTHVPLEHNSLTNGTSIDRHEFLISEIESYISNDHAVDWLSLEIAYRQAIQAAPFTETMDVLNRWQMSEPHAMRYKFGFDPAFGFGY